MNWYIKLKTASPLAPVRCPNCDQAQVVDVGQRYNKANSDAVDNSGTSITRCPNCRKFILLGWQEKALNIAKPKGISIISNEEAMDIIRFDGIALVVSTVADDEEYADLLSITDYVPTDDSNPIKDYEPATSKRIV